ncbi:NAD(P)/FAD-dependent oxidoreductase [[Mycobacterium] burgundiense]|uniref:NAD(P)/FAD-dependent oxidoreductase n=1 Tax=[Mycobacterium] burgundiense TaxID=3064286 RepID=A0ABN9NUI7_9MYCO|nr:NAD(P)/FAD-dependent oxidoreductase [Mycolicibacterium sp. MU0053]CAJ1509986.1 NAD(P)/FAD-dependent oxidoreductase [Mycolicibacterium sp. MU0053]
MIGASAAGISAADGLRDAGFEGRITILSGEDVPPYARHSLSNNLLAAVGDQHPPPLRTSEHFASQEIDLRLGEAATALDIDRQNVITTNGEPIPYDAAIVTTGARARVVRTSGGSPLPVLRTTNDLVALRAIAATCDDIAIIGAGFIGLEVAAVLQESGVQVTVFGAQPLPLVETFGPEVAATSLKLHRHRGVVMQMSSPVVEVRGGPGSYRIVTGDGRGYRAAYVLAAVGAEPDTDWLSRSGVAIDRGIVCDAAGATSVSKVFAAGDAVRSAGNLSRHWAGAVEHGRHVARNLARNERVPFRHLPYVSTTQYGRQYSCCGSRYPGDEVLVIDGHLDGDFVALFTDGSAFHGAASCGHGDLLRDCHAVLRRGATLNDVFRRFGLTGPAAV